MHISNKLWQLREHSFENANIVEEISNHFKISPITAKILVNRGIKEINSVQKFLNPDSNNFYDPFLLKDMKPAVKRIIEGLEKKEKIIIFGDYDVDGITSTSILLSFLKRFTQNVDFYIPDRIEEGYGLSQNSIEKVISMDTNLIITVDCGITAIEEIAYITSKGIDVIVTDHHECKSDVPKAYAVVNPKQADCAYPFKDLAGVGVVFKLVQALAKEMNIQDIIDRYIELAAFGTVADVVPLLDENRTIVYYGLERIRKTNKHGLRSLISISGLAGKEITATSIGYILAPRINAAGRIGNANRGVELFLSESMEQADKIAAELDQNNRERQQTENVILNEAFKKIEMNDEYVNQKVIVLAGEGWHHGVIGIVASRITEKFNKPTILISIDGEEGKGSGRSIQGLNLFEALMSCSSSLGKFGGHELAVGLSIPKENIDTFRIQINEYANSVMRDEDFCPKVKIDAEIHKSDLSLTLLGELKRLEPHGIGNSAPVFLYNDLKMVDCKTVGESKHIKLKLEDHNQFIDGIGFNLGEIAPKIEILDKVDVVCGLEINSWNGQQKTQLNIKDIRTNHEIIFKEKYYSTLEDSIFFDVQVSDLGRDILERTNILDNKSSWIFDGEQLNLILINTLKGARDFINMMNDSKYKNKMRICYNKCDENYSSSIAIINPHLDKIDLSKYDNVIMYDLCFNKNQYEYLILNSKNFYIMGDDKVFGYNIDIFDEIIPKKDELVKVYQYLKSRNVREKVIEGDIFSLTREVAISYNINMNSLKLKKIFEIFLEMKLMNIDFNRDYCKISVNNNANVKVNINASKELFELIQKKEQFKQLVDFLKNKKIC